MKKGRKKSNKFKWGVIFAVYGMCPSIIMLIIHSTNINQWAFLPIMIPFFPVVYFSTFFTIRIAEFFSSNLIVIDVITMVLNFLMFFLIGVVVAFLIDNIRKND